MTKSESDSCQAARRGADTRAALIAAYREGLGLAAVAVVGNPITGIRVAAAASAGEVSPDIGDIVGARWWCRRVADAGRVAALAQRRRAGSWGSLANAGKAVTDAAARLGIVLFDDGDVAEEAAQIIARVDAEVDALQRAGGLKSVNQSYRAYRIEAATGGNKVVPYARWFGEYKANLVRQLANTLRYL